MTDTTHRFFAHAGLLSVLSWFGTSQSASQPADVAPTVAYLAQPKPGTAPEVFAPGLVSTKAEHEFGSVFSSDGLEFFYGVDVGNRTETRCMVFEEGGWSNPRVVLADETYSFNDPFLSPDGARLYFISDMPRDVEEGRNDHDIWYVQRDGGGWSEPINAGSAINTEHEEYYVSFTGAGDMYFGSNAAAAEGHGRDFDLFVSRSLEGEFQPATRLVGDVNTGDYEADVFVSPDEDYLIFSSARADGLGNGDLYVSFRREDGTWKPATNLGAPINSSGHELCPFVTADGERFFYTSDGDIYYVDASVIETHR